MADALTSTHPAAADCLALIEGIQRDLGTVIRDHARVVPKRVLLAAVLETVGTLATLLVAEDASLLPMILNRLEELKVYLATMAQPTQ
jgi:hypothetical protein